LDYARIARLQEVTSQGRVVMQDYSFYLPIYTVLLIVVGRQCPCTLDMFFERADDTLINLRKEDGYMSLPLITFISGISGVLIVMTLLTTMVILSSKLAIALEKKSAKQES